MGYANDRAAVPHILAEAGSPLKGLGASPVSSPFTHYRATRAAEKG